MTSSEKVSPLHNMIFHYTSAQAVLGIVESRALWATHFEFLNDKNEGQVAREMLKRIVAGGHSLDDYTTTALDRFLCFGSGTSLVSFSKRWDNLSLYRTYCPNDGGYCIGFEKSHFEDSSDIFCVDLQYDRKEHSAWVQDFVQRFSQIIKEIKTSYIEPNDAGIHIMKKTGLFKELLHASVRFKGGEFESEEEVRVYTLGSSAALQKVRVSCGGGYLIPYTEIPLSNEEKNVAFMAGPHTHWTLAQVGLHQLTRAATAKGCRWNVVSASGMSTGYRQI